MNVWNLVHKIAIGTFVFAGAFIVALAIVAPRGESMATYILWESADSIHDADNNTKIQTEEGVNDNIIRFDVDSTEKWRLEADGLHTDEWLDSDTNTALGVGTFSAGNLAHTAGSEGWYNTAIGNNALLSATTARYNTGVGAWSLYDNTSGYSNIAVGVSSMANNTIGYSNVAVGEGSLGNQISGWHNTGLGDAVLFQSQDGIGNAALGKNAGAGTASYTGSDYNTLLGFQAGYRIGSNMDNNVFVGYNAASNQTAGSNNISIGANTDLAVLTGSNQLNIANTIYSDDITAGNVGIGITNPSQQLELTKSIELVETGASDEGVIYKGATPFIHNFNPPDNGTVDPDGWNTFVGLNAGNFTMGTTATDTYNASFNTAVGYSTLSSNTLGNSNTAIGIQALNANTTGWANTAVGQNVLISNIDGGQNTVMGLNAMVSNTSGDLNSAFGEYALWGNTTGSRNVAMGINAGTYLVGGATANQTTNRSTYIGYTTEASADGVTNENVFGYNADGIGSNTVVLGNDSIVTTALKGSVGIGITNPSQQLELTKSIELVETGASDEGVIYKGATPFIHNFNPPDNGTVDPDGNNTFIGLNAGNFTMGSTATLSTQASLNVGIGYNSLASNTTGYENAAHGNFSLYSNTSGYRNTANGETALYSNTDGYANSAHGRSALYSNTSGYYNTAQGLNALFSNTDGDLNTADGHGALHYSQTGVGNTAHGAYAIRGTALYTGSDNNTALGYFAGYNMSSNMDNNILVGSRAGYNHTAGSNNIVIGYNTDAQNVTGSNQLSIGNLIFGTGIDGTGTTISSGDIGIGRVPTTNRLEVAGDASKNVAGSWLANSDARLKTNIESLNAQEILDKILSLRGVTYEWSDDKTDMPRPTGIQYGMIAQEIEDVFPSLVSEDADGYLQTAYGTYDAMLIEAIRALKERDDQQREAIRALQEENKRLSDQNEEILRRLEALEQK